jgi:nicotinamide-nucleotide amidase
MTELKALLAGPPPLKLAVAESLTGGRLQARITAESGASDYFLGGMTAYALEEKVRHLGVAEAAARAVNSVSQAVAEQMARGACALFGADVGVATTGYAEPSAPWKVAVPFAWWALARRNAGAFSVTSGRMECPGLPRVEVQERVAAAVHAALVAWLREPAAARRP